VLVRKGLFSSLSSVFENDKSQKCHVLISGEREDDAFPHSRLDRSWAWKNASGNRANKNTSPRTYHVGPSEERRRPE